MISTHTYNFPAIRGIQATREYYVAMCPLNIIPKLFSFDEEETGLSPEIRAQRSLNRSRIPALARYITDNKKDYVFSAITASINGNVKFEPLESKDMKNYLNGTLKVDMSAKLIINDGQHRRAAIEQAIQSEPDLADESIAVVFFIDKGLSKSQQMFSDLNRHAVKPSKSLGILYDHRDDMSNISRFVALKSEAFRGLVEMEKSTLSQGSRKLFTLSAIHSGCQALLEPLKIKNYEESVKLCNDYWDTVANQFDDWKLARDSKISSREIRLEKVHANAITLQCFGIIGSQILVQNTNDWKNILTKLQDIDWHRSNAEIWEGRMMQGGRISKTNSSITLTVNIIKKYLGLGLTESEKKLEDAYCKKEGNK